MLASGPVAAVDQPYPGLRSFEANEAVLFHGRARHTEELLRRLSHNRFLAVVGGSGSGKSSLVRAGLLPALYRGYLVGATSRWRVAVMRPGSSPLAELTRALRKPDALGSSVDEEAIRESSYGLVNAVRAASLADGESILLLVDQFEELFRFRRVSADRDGGAEAALFASQLLCAADEFGAPVYVAITMRSDFLGDCAQFQGLPEALNKSQYLIPRMTREQRREAVTDALDFFDASMSHRLVQQLLNDSGDDPDQLPVLQHALQQTYALWVGRGRVGEIDLEHYREVGTMEHALHRHAERVLKSTGDSAWIAERIFRCLTVDENGRAVRRPARFERILRVIGVAGDSRLEIEAARIIALFAAPENSFLLWGSKTALQPDSVVDISHETLIRKWATLQEWVRDEARGVDIYRYLRRDASRYPNEAGLWSEPALAGALNVKAAMGWNEAWAEQYSQAPGAGYSQVEAFLGLSVKDREAKQRRERMFMRLYVGVAALVVALVIGGAWLAKSEREKKAIQVQADGLKKANAALEKEKETLSDEASKKDEEIRAAETKALNNQGDPAARLEVARLQEERNSIEKKLEEREALLQGNSRHVSQMTPDYSASLRRINDLQTQLKQAWDERDRARAENIDAPAKPESDDPAAVRRQLDALQTENARLRLDATKIAQPRAQPGASPAVDAFYPLVVPKYSWQLYPKESPRLGVILGDLGSTSSTARIYVYALPSPLMPPQAYVDKADIVRPKIVQVSQGMLCPSAPDPTLPMHCFVVHHAETNKGTQLLGTINVGSAAFAVHAMGWVNLGRPDALSLALVSAGAAVPRATPVVSHDQVGTLLWDRDKKDKRFASLGDTVREWEGSFLNYADLTVDNALTLIAFSTTNRTLIDEVRRTGDQQPVEKALKPSDGMQLSPETFHAYTIHENETCWVTLPSGQLVAVTARDLGYVRGRVELALSR